MELARSTVGERAVAVVGVVALCGAEGDGSETGTRTT